MGVFNVIGAALTGKSQPANVGTGKVGAAGPPVPVPDSVKQAQAAAYAKAAQGHTTSGLDAAMQAHADKMHPVKP